MLLALWSGGVSLAAISWLSISLCFSLSMVSSMRDNLGVMTNNSRAMMDLLVCLLAVLGHNILTFFNVCGVNNNIIFFMAFLSLVLDWLLMALLVWLAEALEVVVWFVAITWLSLSLSFDISMTSMDNLGIMTHNSRTVVDLLSCLLTVFSDNVFTLFDVGCINNSLAHLTRDLLGFVLWDLVTVSVNMFLTMRLRAVSFMTSISLMVSISSMMCNNMRVMSNYMRAFVNYMRALVNLCMGLLAVLCDNIFTFFMVNSVNDNIIFLMTFLSFFVDWLLVTLFLNILVTLWSRRVSLVSSLSIRDWSTGHKTNTDKSNTQFIHF